MTISIKTARDLNWWLAYWIPQPKRGGTWLFCVVEDKRFKTEKKYRRHFRKEHAEL